VILFIFTACVCSSFSNVLVLKYSAERGPEEGTAGGGDSKRVASEASGQEQEAEGTDAGGDFKRVA
jgi:hypothetical protein